MFRHLPALLAVIVLGFLLGLALGFLLQPPHVDPFANGAFL